MGGSGRRRPSRCGALALVDRAPPHALDRPLPVRTRNYFQVEWERAAWANAGRPDEEHQAKQDLLRWRLHGLLARATDDMGHAYEAVAARPDLHGTRVTLARALSRAGRLPLAVSHLGRAVRQCPFDPDAARALYEALRASGDPAAAEQLAAQRRLPARMAPALVGPEAWFGEPPREPHEEPTVTAHPVEPTATLVGLAGLERPRGRARPGERQTPTLPLLPPLPERLRPRVSLCLIARNEAGNVGPCLDSAAGLADEVVVIDTGSADGTRAEAESRGARVFDFPWSDSFAEARNESVRRARGQWVFWLDCDDRIDAANRDKLRTLFDRLGDENAGYIMTVRSAAEGADQGKVVDQVRLFRNYLTIRWEYRVHEQILASICRAGGADRWTDVVVQHVGYQDNRLVHRKHERKLRLLYLENADRPDDPFTLFNLGWTYQAMARHHEALPFLRRSLGLAQPNFSFTRKLYALLVTSLRRLGQRDEALAVCRQGRGHYPDDVELRYQEGMLLYEGKDLAGAEARLEELLGGGREAYFAIGVETGLRGYLTRYNLGVICRDRGKLAEAEAHWKRVVDERPGYTPAWLGLAELYMSQKRFDEVEAALGRLEADPRRALEAAVLRGRLLVGREEPTRARHVLEAAVPHFPEATVVRLLLSHALLQEGRDWDAAEKVLRDVLALDPDNPQARQNLETLRLRRPAARQGRKP